MLTELEEWPGPALKRHNDAKHPIHKLTFIADLGLGPDNPHVGTAIERILNRRSQEGPFQILVNIPTRFGGKGEDELAWMLCDAPLILYALVKFGMTEDQRVKAAAQYLAGLVRDNGWPCAATTDFGKFRGPGRKTDLCPYANLVMLKALSEMPEWRDGKECRVGADALLGLWEKRKERRPYLFAMGSGFVKLKAPLIWYDILHVLDVLTRFPWLRGDPRLREMVDIVASKVDEEGRFTAESVWKAGNEWGFGQKREPSRWITFIVRRILKRMDE